MSDLTQRILGMNFAAIHTSSMVIRPLISHSYYYAILTNSKQSFTHALYQLATYPEYIGPMREETERVISSEGWSKASMQKLYKIDSFLRESQRFYSLTLCEL